MFFSSNESLFQKGSQRAHICLCERSEAIQEAVHETLDCFTAFAKTDVIFK